MMYAILIDGATIYAATDPIRFSREAAQYRNVAEAKLTFIKPIPLKRGA
jgi:hypothetical protein